MPPAQPQTVPSAAAHLADLGPGDAAVIAGLDGDFTTCRRLAEMGFNPGVTVRVERVAPLGDPIEVAVRGYRISLRRDQAGMIRLGGSLVQSETRPAAAVSLPGPGLPLGRDLVVALAGNPNCGKTTLFNAITGLRQQVANYPGVTVDKKIGRAPLEDGNWASVIDLPGVYSLTPTSPDERVAVEVLAAVRNDTPVPDVALVVVDAGNLERNLLLATQIIDSGLPVVLALSMMDEARRRGIAPDADALERLLGVPVIPIVAATGEGLLRLRQALSHARCETSAPWHRPETDVAVDALTAAVSAQAERCGRSISPQQARFLAWHLLGDSEVAGAIGPAAIAPLTKAAERARGDGRLVLSSIDARYAWISSAVAQVQPQAAGSTARRDRLDDTLLHRLFGPCIFALVMWALFMAIFTLAEPAMHLAEQGVIAFGGWLAGFLGTGLLHDLWLDGVVAGVGGVVVFAPQIAIMFVLFAVLEESGYLARGAFMLDRVLSAVGLHGRSFVPLLSSHACAIPGIMAARTIPDPRERLATMLVAPFMACSARLPVYGLIIGAIFGSYAGWQQGSILFALYAGGIVIAALVSWTLRHSVLTGRGSSFLIELPPYRWPNPGEVIRVTGRAVWAFMQKAGTIILALSILLWAAMNFPRLPDERVTAITAAHGSAESIQQEALRHSVAGRAGRLVEPLIRPLGMDWQIGVGLIGAVAAREVFVSTMGISYGVGVDEHTDAPLQERMLASTRADGSPVWTPLLAVVVLVWFVIAMQCFSTIAVMVRETGGWRWPLLQLVGMNSLAWLVCCAIWQIGSRL
jgi:ferrous iron transport protein B